MQYRNVHWDVENGLSSGMVGDFIRDRNGFTWIGTSHGLNRFDGSSFKKYLANNPEKNQSIAGNDIQGLIEDSLHNIWIGSKNGLSVYDIVADSFRNYFPSPGIGTTSTIIPFWSTEGEVFCWNYPDSQLTAFNIHTFAKRTLVNFLPGDSIGWGVSDHYSIFDKATNSIWFERGYLTFPGGGLLRISLTDGSRQQYNWNCFNRIPNHNHSSEGMRYDRKRNSIWINSSDGLLEFTLQDRQFHDITVMNSLEKLKGFHQWTGIDIDPAGRVWVTTFPFGVTIYDPTNQTFSAVFPDNPALQQNTSIQNTRLFCDREGMAWTGSWASNGINQVIPYIPSVRHYVANPKEPNSLSSDFVAVCMQGGGGKIWMGTGGGINIFDPVTNLFQHIQIRDMKGVRGGDWVYIAGIDTVKQRALVGADALYQMDIATRTCLPVSFKDQHDQLLPATTGGVPTAFKDAVLIAAPFENNTKMGLFLLPRDSMIAREVLSFPMGTIDMFKTVTDNDHLLFIRQPDSVLNLTYTFRNGKWVRMNCPLDSLSWKSLYYNAQDQSFWLSAEDVLYHFDKGYRLIRSFAQRDGLPGLEIGGMTTDSGNNLWFTTESTIHCLDNKTQRITMLSEKDGFQKQNFTTFLKFGKANNGDLYWPNGVYGLGFNRIFPSKYNQTPAYVYLQSVSVNQHPAAYSGIRNLEELNFSYKENNITIETGIIDYYSRGDGHIRYKLGKDEEWQYPVNSARYTIHYEGLAPGSYSLVMQASNSSNEFAGPEKTLVIHISPPWWQTWWARSLFVLTFIAVLWGFIQYRSRNLKRKNLELEEKVMHRTKELKHSLEDLRATQAQLIQREKMASLGELTAGIAHEIQNPLNFVNNFSDLNSELIDEMKQEIQSGNTTDGLELADTIRENNLKINSHGRRADSIVKGMLLHSRQSQGKMEDADLNSLADEYLRLSYHGLRSKDKSFLATIQTDYDDQLGKIKIVPQDIGRVFLNLFNNSFYTLAEKKKMQLDGFEPMIRVSTRKSGQQVEVKVRDNGLGIPSRIIDKVFQPFFTTKPTGDGTGLGLSLSYDIITKGHGGAIQIETNEGEFTEVILTIPIISNS